MTCQSVAELLLRRAWFPGDTDLDQLGKIFQALGTPSQDTWPGCACLPQYVEFQTTAPPPLRNTFRQARPCSCAPADREPLFPLLIQTCLVVRWYSKAALPPRAAVAPAEVHAMPGTGLAGAGRVSCKTHVAL